MLTSVHIIAFSQEKNERLVELVAFPQTDYNLPPHVIFMYERGITILSEFRNYSTIIERGENKPHNIYFLPFLNTIDFSIEEHLK